MWRVPSDFVENAENIVEDGSNTLRLLTDRVTGRQYVGKCSALTEVQRTQSHDCLSGAFEQELLEAFALVLYAEAFGVHTPAIHLCSLPSQRDLAERGVAEPGAERAFILIGCDPRVTRLGPSFLKEYRAHARQHPEERYTLRLNGTGDGSHVTQTSLPLVGFGALMAAAVVLDDCGVLGPSGANAGYKYVPCDSEATCEGTEASPTCGRGFFRIVKLDAGEAFHFRSNPDPDEEYNIYSEKHLNDRPIFAELTRPDRDEYVATLKQALTDLCFDDVGSKPQSAASAETGVDPCPLLERLRSRIEPQPDSHGKRHPSRSYPKGYLAYLSEGLRQRIARLADHYSSNGEFSTKADADQEAAINVREWPSLHGPLDREGECRTFQLPPLTNMVGRRVELERLRTALSAHGGGIMSHALVGMGGVGKTTLAAAYAIDAARHATYSHVIWLRVDSDKELDQQFHSLADTWCQIPKEIAANQSASSIVWECLALARRPSLVVFDNLHDLAQLKCLLPTGITRGSIHVLATSRDSQPQEECAVLNLSPFSHDESREFLRLRLRDIDFCDDAIICRLHETLGGLPLAIQQLIGYVRATGRSLVETLDAFDSMDVENEDRWALPVNRMVSVSLAYLESYSHDAEAVLAAASLLPPDDLRRDELMGCSECTSDALDIALRELQALELVFRCPYTGRGAFRIHRVIQQCVRHYLTSVGSLDHVVERAATFFETAPGGAKCWSYAFLSQLLPLRTSHDEKECVFDRMTGMSTELRTQNGSTLALANRPLNMYVLEDTIPSTRPRDLQLTTPLLDAMRQGNVQLVELILRGGSGVVNQRDQNGRTAWHYTVLFMSANVLLLLHRYNVAHCDLEDNNGVSPLQLAVEQGNVDMIQALVILGADPYRYSEKLGSSTMDYCDKYNDHAALAILRTIAPRQQMYPLQLPPALAMANMTPLDVLIHAIFVHDYVTVRRILSRYPEFCTSIHETKGTLLMYGVQCGDVKVIEALLENGCSPHLGADDGVTAFHLAASNIQNGDEILDCLLGHSGYVALIDRRGRSAIDWAITSRNAYAYRRLTAALQPRIMMTALESQQAVDSLDAALRSCVQEAAELTEELTANATERPCNQLMRRGPLELMVRPPRMKWASRAFVLVDATLNDSRDTIFVHRLVFLRFEPTEYWYQMPAQQDIQIVCLLRGNTYLCDEAYLNCEGLGQLTLWCKDQFNRHTVAAITSGIDSLKPRSQRATTENRSNLVIIGPGSIKIYTICIEGDSPKEYLLECSAAPAMIESQEVQLRDECSNDLYLRALLLWEALKTSCPKKTACVPVESTKYSYLTKNEKKIEANDTNVQREETHQRPLSEAIPLIGVIEVRGGVQDEPDNKVPVASLSALGGARGSLIPDVESTTGMCHADQCKTLFPPAHEDAGEPEFKLALLANCMAHICFGSFESGRQIMGTIPVCLQSHERVKLLQRVLRILERSCGTEHPCVAAMVIALAQAWANDQ